MNYRKEHRIFQALSAERRLRLRRILNQMTHGDILVRYRSLVVLALLLAGLFTLMAPNTFKLFPLPIMVGYVLAFNLFIVKFYIMEIRSR